MEPLSANREKPYPVDLPAGAYNLSGKAATGRFQR
jgi:hypothetical protein